MIALRLLETPPDPEAVRESLERTFSRPEFIDEDGIFDRILRWIGERLADIFDAAFPDIPIGGAFGGGIGSVLAYLVMFLGILAVLVGLFFVLRNSSFRRKRSGATDEVEFSEDESRSAGEWRTLAELAERDGKFLEALRARYRELVMTLVEGSWVPSAPGRSTGELRTDVALHLPAASAAFDPLSDRFDVAYYGGEEVTEAQLAEAKEWCRSVVTLAESTKPDREPEPSLVEVGTS